MRTIWRCPWFQAGALFGGALLLRLVFAFQWQGMPYGASPQLDADMYDKWAWSLAQGGAGEAGAFYQSPLYPYVLAGLYRLFGHNLLAAGILNAFFDSVTVVLIAGTARRLYDFAAGWIAGGLAAIFAPMVFYVAAPMKEPLTLLLCVVFVTLSLRALGGVRARDYAGAGLLLGLTALARGNAVLLAPLVPVFAWGRYRHAALRPGLVFMLAFFAALAPSAWHNYRAAHEIIPLTYAGGFNLYIGHAPTSNGANAYPPEVSTGPDQEKLDTAWIAAQETGKPLGPAEVSAFWRNKALGFAFADPAREVRLWALKIRAFLNNADRFDNYDRDFIKENYPSLLNWLPSGFGVLMALAVFSILAGGAGTRWSDRRFLIVGAAGYAASVLVFYVTDRYRLPMVVFALPLVGGISAAVRELRMHSSVRRRVGALTLTAAALGLAFASPADTVDLRAFHWGVVTAAAAGQGDEGLAMQAFEKALALSPTGAGVQAYVRIASLYEKRGQQDAAEALIDRAVALFPQDGVALYNKGRMQALRGDLDGALATMARARALAPTYTLIYYAQARLYEKKGDQAASQAALRDGLAFAPADPYLVSWGRQEAENARNQLH